MPWKVAGWHLLFSVAGCGEMRLAVGQPEQAGRMGEEMAGVLSLQTSFLAVSAHVCVCVCLCRCMCFLAQVSKCVGVCIYVLCVHALLWVCVFKARVHVPLCVCVCLPVSLHKRRLSWQLAALLGNCFAKFRLLLSNIQTPPNHQPAKRPGLCLMPDTPSSPLLKLQSPSLLQAPRSVPRLPHSSFLAQRVLGSLHSVSCGCLWLWSQVNQGWRFAD